MWFGILCVGGALFFLESGLWGRVDRSRHMSSGRICFMHVGASDRPLPTIYVSGEARAPDSSGVVVVNLSRESLTRFLGLLESEQDAPATERQFGTFDVDDTIQEHPAKRRFANRR
jgi:hypothetical protein